MQNFNFNDLTRNPMTWILLAVIGYLVFGKAKAALLKWRLDRSAAEQSEREAIDNLAHQIRNFGLEAKALRIAIELASQTPEKMLAGATAACEAIAATTDKHRETVEEVRKLLFTQASASARDNLETASEAERDRVYAEMAHRAAGKTDEESAALAQAESEAGGAVSMYPAS